ncbi:SprT-like family-domain-containing protein [Scleroderma yunnanense]
MPVLTSTDAPRFKPLHLLDVIELTDSDSSLELPDQLSPMVRQRSHSKSSGRRRSHTQKYISLYADTSDDDDDEPDDGAIRILSDPPRSWVPIHIASPTKNVKKLFPTSASTSGIAGVEDILPAQAGSPSRIHPVTHVSADRFVYADTNDDVDDEPDDGAILVLNDPPRSRVPIRISSPTKNGERPFPTEDSMPKSTRTSRIASVEDILPARVGSPSKIHPVANVSTDKLASTPCRKSKKAQEAEEQARREQYAADLFTQLNQTVFDNRLPKETKLEWNKRLLTTAGRARWHRSRDGVDTTRIELAAKILDCDERIRNTLSHEMCHLACWVINNSPQEGHGQLFKSWGSKVMRKYPDIRVSTRHNYEISYPYEWKCERCSKIYGRYSKSIRPEACLCGVCKVGKLVPQFSGRMSPQKMTAASPQTSDKTGKQILCRPGVPSRNEERDKLAEVLEGIHI